LISFRTWMKKNTNQHFHIRTAKRSKINFISIIIIIQIKIYLRKFEWNHKSMFFPSLFPGSCFSWLSVKILFPFLLYKILVWKKQILTFWQDPCRPNLGWPGKILVFWPDYCDTGVASLYIKRIVFFRCCSVFIKNFTLISQKSTKINAKKSTFNFRQFIKKNKWRTLTLVNDKRKQKKQFYN